MAIIDFAGLSAQLGRDGKLAALDLGTRTIGVAASDLRRMLASPVGVIRRTKLAPDLVALDAMLAPHHPLALVLGLPLNMDGTEGPRCQSVRQFATNLVNHAPPALRELPLFLQDERLSTAAVTRGMIDDYDMTRARRAERVDAAAAAWILESTLQRLANAPP
ncbi:MAG: Holliday junction resolvase RuvX [Alphaproteobacteria bacterium]|nr:Holliday junction resolvase RuvX [Alphaproteobacteria bacterium]